MYFPATELVLNERNEVYHLALNPNQLAHKVILVGDQDRVKLISTFFETIEHQSQHREFVCHTGTYKGKRISVLSTGIGTDNIDICLQELDALVNIDLEQRTEKTNKTQLELVRIGTCGILQSEIPLHSYLLSSHAYGFDNVAHFYPIDYTAQEIQLCSNIDLHLNLPYGITPYLISADKSLTDRLSSSETHTGITVTSSGFYGPQGRSLRLESKIKDIHIKLGSFNQDETKIVNFEMESSAIFALGRQLGHACATICLGVANRPNLEFSTGCEQEMNELIQYVLERI
ncbi:MAG: nucleoside phosphorylase [Crocinitomicaceae bacterium]|nr:nucleoside phosphorylase [Crocinitomicaceae bacterium]MBP6032410.1 nucleoside phosphorylase [Crocinitomicaceae bacterium]